MANNKNISPENALNRLAALCSRSEQAESDLRSKLRSWGIADADADAIIDRLYNLRFLDRERYTRAFVRDKFRFEGWGKIKITFQLRQKGFDACLIEDALTEIADEEYSERLTQLLATKARSLHGKEYLQAKASLVRFAASRGFEPALIYKIIPKVLTKHPDCDADCHDSYLDD